MLDLPKYLEFMHIQSASKRVLQLWRPLYIYLENMYIILNSHVVEKHTKSYLR
jgi:hypothetical protein